MLSALETKMSEEVRLGSGVTNTPEPEELKEMGRVPQREEMVPLSPEFVCQKPIRNPNRPNKSFHRYNDQLWSIRAMKYGRCSLCKKAIMPRQEITLVKKSVTWVHFDHSVSQPEPEKPAPSDASYFDIF